MRIAVVGAGAVGSAVAHRLAASGAEVALIDGADPARGLSAHSFGWINPVDNGSDAYYDLTLAAVAAHRRLAAGRSWLGETGNLHWADTAAGHAGMLATAAGYRARGYPVRELDPREVAALEPALRLGAPAGPAVFYPDDGYVQGDRMIADLHERARRHGAVVLVGDPVVDIVEQPAGAGVRLASGRTITADRVVCCAGRGTNALLHRTGHTIPMVEPDDPGAVVRGLLVRTAPVPRPVRRVVHAPGLSIRPAAGGRFVLRCRDVDVALTADSRPDEHTGTVLDRLAAVLPDGRGAAVESAFVGERPLPLDGMSVLGPVPGADTVYAVATHSGVTLAAVIAEVVEHELTRGPHPLAAAFRPQRFTADAGR